MRLIALSLLLCLSGAARAAPVESRPPRPREVDLRRLYPPLGARWRPLKVRRVLLERRRRGDARAEEPAEGFLAAPSLAAAGTGPASAWTAAEAASAAPGAWGGAGPRRQGRGATWTLRGGPKGRDVVELARAPSGLIYPVSVR